MSSALMLASVDTFRNQVIHTDALTLVRSLPKHSIDLICTDPPYNGVKDDAWDNQWATDADYLNWLGELCREWQRVLKPNGSLYVFASPQMAARVELKIAEYFNVLNHIAWAKPFSRHMGADIDGLRGYFPKTERVIFAEQCESDNHADALSGFTEAEALLKKRIFGLPILEAMETTKTSSHELTGAIGAYGKVNHGGAVSNWINGYNVPTREQYEAMRQYLNSKGGEYLRRDYEELRRDYEELRRDYEELRRPFNLTEFDQYTDIWTFKTVGTYEGKHPAEKPLDLIKHIIKTSSRDGAIVLDCFGGSGTTFDACRQLDRHYIGCDFDERWVKYSRNRVEKPYKISMFAA